MLVFAENGKPEYLEKNLSEQGENQQQTQPTYDAEPWPHWSVEASALTSAPPLLPSYLLFNIFVGMIIFGVSGLVMVVVSVFTEKIPRSELGGLTWSTISEPPISHGAIGEEGDKEKAVENGTIRTTDSVELLTNGKVSAHLSRFAFVSHPKVRTTFYDINSSTGKYPSIAFI